ncbi:MAG: hypothetical protein REI09_13125, partial [Candidatus Dactylopiibacterium sp.]|nr:hypothetical protein [Candidatus Dactylopiibacterium sp.]
MTSLEVLGSSRDLDDGKLYDVYLDARSLLRSTFQLNAPYLNAVGQERNEVVALARRFLFLPLAYHFDFREGA